MVIFLHKNKHITTLSLKGCQIGDEDVKELANSNLINLTSLNLLGNGIKVSDEGNFVDFSPHDAKDRTENGEGVLTKLRHRAEIMKKSQEISNVQVSVQSNENQQMKAEMMLLKVMV